MTRELLSIPMTRDEKDEALAMLKNGKSGSEVCAWIGCTPRQLRELKRVEERKE